MTYRFIKSSLTLHRYHPHKLPRLDTTDRMQGDMVVAEGDPSGD